MMDKLVICYRRGDMTTVKARIPFVDGEKSTSDLLKGALDGHAYLCETAPGAQEALERLMEHPFDLVLLDAKMPGLSGMDLLTVMTVLPDNCRHHGHHPERGRCHR